MYQPRFDLAVIFHQMLFLMQPSQQLLNKSVSHSFQTHSIEDKVMIVYQPTSFSEYDDYELVTFPAKDDLIAAHKRTSNSAQQRVGSRKSPDRGESNRWMERENKAFRNPWAETATVAPSCCVAPS